MANKVIFSSLGSSPKDKIINIALIIIIIVAVIMIYNFWFAPTFKAWWQKLRNKGELNTEIASGGKLSYDDNKFRNLAGALYTAMKGAGTDTTAVYNVFKQMNTKADVLKLIDAFGIRDGETLAEWMRAEWFLSISSINSILNSKGIDYTF